MTSEERISINNLCENIIPVQSPINSSQKNSRKLLRKIYSKNSNNNEKKARIALVNHNKYNQAVQFVVSVLKNNCDKRIKWTNYHELSKIHAEKYNIDCVLPQIEHLHLYLRTLVKYIKK